MRRVSNIWGLQQKYFLATVGGLRDGQDPSMFDGGCRKDIFSFQKEMLNPVGWNNSELHMLADYLNLRGVKKPKETLGVCIFIGKNLKNLMMRDFHNSHLNPGRIVWISGRDSIIFNNILKSLSSEAGRIRQTLCKRQCGEKFRSYGPFQDDTVCAPLLGTSIRLLLKANIQYLEQVSSCTISR